MCNINILPISAISTPSGEIKSITVKGTAPDCDIVVVSIRCRGNEVKKEERVKSDDTFTVTFTDADNLSTAECQCDGDITVRVSCKEHSNRRETWVGRLECIVDEDEDPKRDDEDEPKEDEDSRCPDDPQKLIECSPPKPAKGPQYIVPFRQPLPFLELDFSLGSSVEQNLPTFACVKVADYGMEVWLTADLRYEQRWFFQGVSISDLVSTIALAPGEKTTLQLKKTQRKLLQQETLDSVEEMESTESTLIDKDVVNVTRASSKTENWKVDGSAGIRLGKFSFNLGAGYSSTINNTSTSSVQRMNEATRKSANNLKTMHKVEVQEVSEETLEQGVSRTITNPYHDRPLTIKVFELSKEYCIETVLVEASPSIIITLEKLDFDYRRGGRHFVLNNGSFLAEFLLDPGLQIELASALETVTDLRSKDNEARATSVAKLCLKYLFDTPNMFNIPPGLGGPNPNLPESSFNATPFSGSGLGDAKDKFGVIFTTLNFYFKVYRANEFQEAQLIDFVLSLEKYIGALWGAVKQGENLDHILDPEQYTEIFRRLSGFLSMVSGVLRPLVQPFEKEQEALRAQERAEFVIQRVAHHLKCHSDYYTEKYLAYIAERTSLTTVKEFVREMFEKKITSQTQKEQIKEVFDIERLFLDGRDIVIPVLPGKGHEDIRVFNQKLVKNKEKFDFKLGRKGKPIKIRVPFDGTHFEAVTGHCPPLAGVPPRAKFSFDADVSIESDEE